MTRVRRAYAGLALVALIAPSAVVAALTGPAVAEADGKHKHDLDTYKREAWVELLGSQTAHTGMSCDPGDYALDGMWKVDAHDGDDRAVRATISRRNSVDEEDWEFELVNDGAGRAQLKTFVTCLDNRTGERENHTHRVVEAPRGDGVQTAVAAGQKVFLSATCGSDEIPVSPSFLLTGGSDARLLRSYPAAGLHGWEWTFLGGASPGFIDVSIYCLERTSSSAQGHTHVIDADLRPGPLSGGQVESVPVAEQSDFRITARPHDEGNVGAFALNHDQLHYLGQDAQGQVRGFRFSNPVGSGTVTLAIWGFDKRTGKNS